jgi:hypothetical protein
MLPIMSDVVTREPVPERPMLLANREVIRAAIAGNLVRVEGTGADAWRRAHTEVLPHEWVANDDVEAARTFESEAFGYVVNWMHSAMVTEAAAHSREPGQGHVRTRLNELPDEPLTHEQLTVAREQFEAAFTWSDEFVREHFPFMPLQSARLLLETMKGQFRRMLERTGVVGPRRAYLEALGMLPGDVPERRFLDQVTVEVVFGETVRETATQFLRATPAEAEYLASTIRIEHCPGQWLARAVELEARRAEAQPDASNSHDLDHLAFLPYVDVLFTDRRMGTYATSALRRADIPGALSNVRPPQWVASSIEAIEAALP